MAKPTLGYPSRTDAIEALRREGLDTAAIAARLGVKRDIVLGSERARAKAVFRGGNGMTDTPTVRPTMTQLPYFERAAKSRGTTPSRLLRDLLWTVVRDDLIDAVLDDGAGR